jgi:hypothetical protein
LADLPAGGTRVFLVHQGDAKITPLLDGLRERGTEPYVLSDVAVLGGDLLDALRVAVERADLVVVVLHEEGALNASFEAGFAHALGKPLLFIVAPGIKIPGDVASQIVVHARPGDLDAIHFVLDQVERRTRSISPGAAGPRERAIGRASAEQLLERLRRLPHDSRSVTALLVEAIEASGAIATEKSGPDEGFDIGVWSDDLAAIGANPLVVEVKPRLRPESTSQALRALAQHPTAKLALIVQLEPSPDETSRATGSHRALFPVLTISFEQLIRRMAVASFAEVIRDLRNQSVHGRAVS